jgi:hypothetical protein
MFGQILVQALFELDFLEVFDATCNMRCQLSALLLSARLV